MNKFNIEEYEPVEDRLRKFHKDYKEGRVVTEMVEYTDDRVVFKATLFRNFEEQTPWATGFAEETRGVGGLVNATSHLENAETSAIGRALANAGYAPKGKRPSREEMLKVRRGLNEKQNNVQTPISQTQRQTQNSEAYSNSNTRARRTTSTSDINYDTLKEIKRLYALTAKLNPEAQNIGHKVTKMVVEKGYASLNSMPVKEIKSMADQLERTLAE